MQIADSRGLPARQVLEQIAVRWKIYALSRARGDFVEPLTIDQFFCAVVAAVSATLVRNCWPSA